jgi:hypothetical protein
MKPTSERIINPRPTQGPSKPGNLQKGSHVAHTPSPVNPNSNSYKGVDIPIKSKGAMK